MKQIAVIGTHKNPSKKSLETAFEIGKLLAQKGFVLVSGGLGGVMEEACRGAKEAGGITVGILPGREAGEANRFVDVRVVTGLEWARNQVVALSSDALVMVGGEAGTLSEACVGWMYGKPIVAIAGTGGYADAFAGKPIDAKRSDRIHKARNAKEAIALVEKLAGGGG